MYLIFFKYVKNSLAKDLLFEKHGCLIIEAYSNADYAVSRDDHKFTSGYFTYLGGNLVTSKVRSEQYRPDLVQKLWLCFVSIWENKILFPKCKSCLFLKIFLFLLSHN